MVNQRTELKPRIHHKETTRKSFSFSSSSSSSDSSSDQESNSSSFLTRKEKNRLSANQSRFKKEKLIIDLSLKAQHLETENNYLQSLLSEVIQLHSVTNSNFSHHSTKEQAMFY